VDHQEINEFLALDIYPILAIDIHDLKLYLYVQILIVVSNEQESNHGF